MSVKKKFNKLVKNPKAFFNDMYFKHSNRLKKHIPVKYQGNHQFTVVAAVYNVSKYLDEFFESLVKQSLDFKKHIQIICVDDGSKDNSAEIIKKWQKKYPQNIHYIYKENGGQASARNLGIQEVKTEWVTFIDPDDFVSNDYFHKIDDFLTQEKEITLVGLPLVFYFEDKNIFKDTHPLKYRFAKGNAVFSIDDLENQLQLSASTAIFKTNNITNNNISFDEKMKPSFEDAKFVTDYILQSNKPSQVGFVSGVSYFYRKRSDGSSTLDGAWNNPLLFSRVLSDGCIAVLKNAENKFGYVPKHIQRIALYHIIWYFGRIVNNSSSLSHLTEEQRKQFVDLVFEMFSYIDEKTIMEFNLGGTWFFQKVALLGLFKNQQPPYQIAYVEKYDLAKDQILVSYFSHFPVLEEWRLDGKDQLPAFQKTVKYKFLDHLYAREYRTWIPCQDNCRLELFLNKKVVNLTFAGKRHKALSISEVKKHFLNCSTVKNQDWILMDRDHQADDNAEHLYRYISKYHPERSIYFALRKNSHDWERLEQEGFKLLAFGTPKFEDKLRQCAKIISSHIDDYIVRYFNDDTLLDKDIVFLQHGITKDNLSKWFNTKKISCFVTVTKPEYCSIADNDSPYKFTKKEVQCTGFPRYDRLLKGNCENTKQILIMPTWRNTIVGEHIGNGKRERNPNFMRTSYARHWYSFIKSDYVKKLHTLGYEIIFAPHPNIQPYLSEFVVPDYVRIYRYSEGNVQSLFQKCSLMITDYSSVAFDAAYLNKAIVYYQFDYNEVFSGEHFYQKGYFEYERDGFGEVVYDEKSLCNAIEKTLANKGKPLPIYEKRIKETFPFRDDKNCERVYQAIKALDEPETKTFDLEIGKNAIQTAFNHQAWDLVSTRSRTFLSATSDAEQAEWAKEMLLTSLLRTYRFDELASTLSTLSNADHIAKWRMNIAFIRQDWKQVIDLHKDLANLSAEQKMMLLQAYIELQYREEAKRLIEDLKLATTFEPMQEKILTLWENVLKYPTDPTDPTDPTVLKEWAKFEEELVEFSNEKLRQYQPQLLLSRLYRKAGLYDAAHKQLVNFEKHTQGNLACRIEIAQLAFARQNYDKVITQLERGFKEEQIQYLSENCMRIYFISLIKTKQKEKLTQILDKALAVCPNDKYLLENQLEQRLTEKNLELTFAAMHKLWSVSQYIDMAYFYLLIQNKMASDFFNHLEILENDEEKRYLSGKFAVACGNWKMAERHLEKCNLQHTNDLLLMVRIYAEQQKNYQYTSALQQLSTRELSSGQRNLLESFEALKRQDWDTFIEHLALSLFTKAELTQYKPHLLISRALRKTGDYRNAHQYLVNYEKLNKNDVMFRLAVARLAFANKNYTKCINQFKIAFNNQTMAFSENAAIEYCNALLEEKHFDVLRDMLPKFEAQFPNTTSFKNMMLFIAMDEKDWEKVLILSESVADKSAVIYPIVFAYMRLGQLEKAYQIYEQPTIKHNYEYWALIAELGILMEDFALAKKCYKHLIAVYPEKNRTENMDLLFTLIK